MTARKNTYKKITMLLSFSFVCLFFMSSIGIYAADEDLPAIMQEYISIEDFISYDKDSTFSGGNGSKSNPYLIKTSDDLAQLSVNVGTVGSSNTSSGNEIISYDGKYFRLENDIDLSKFASADKYVVEHPLSDNQHLSTEWLPIGGFYFSEDDVQKDNMVVQQVHCFNGIFDGNGHTISNISINEQNDRELMVETEDNETVNKKKYYKYIGLFGVLGSEAVVKNLNIEDESINFGSRNITMSNYNTMLMEIGGIAGCVKSSNDCSASIENCYINNLTIQGSGMNNDDIDGDLIGGIIGDNYANVDNCSVNIKESYAGSYSTVGGIAGKNRPNALISNVSVKAGEIRGLVKSSVGGVVGNNEGNISSAQSQGKINAINASSVGGIAAFSSSKVVNCSAEANIENQITLSDFTQRSEKVATGGIIGNNAGKIFNSCSKSDIDFSVYSNPESNSITVGCGGICGINSSNAEIDNCYYAGEKINVDTSNSPSADSVCYAGALIGSNLGTSINNVYYAGSIDAIGNIQDSSNDEIKTYNKTVAYMQTSGFLDLLNANKGEYRKWYKTAETKLPSFFNGYGYSSSNSKVSINWFDDSSLFSSSDFKNATNVDLQLKTDTASAITTKELNSLGPKGSVLYKTKITFTKSFLDGNDKSVSTGKVNTSVNVSINYSFTKQSGYDYFLVKKYNNKVTKVSYTYKNKIISFKADNLGNGVSYYLVRTVIKPTAPKKTSITSIKNSKKKTAVVKWKKVSGANGYEVYRSLKKNSGYKKVKTTTSTSFTNKGLKKKKTYYYKIRAYKTRYGVSSYSGYSAVKQIKIKK